jgi:hypothetical protein
VKNGHHATLFQNQDLRDIITQNHLVEWYNLFIQYI